MIEAALKIHPMMPVNRASAVLKESVDSLEAKLSLGEIKGEKRQVSERPGARYSWFIYASEFTRLLDEHVKACEKRVSTDGLEQIFDQALSAYTSAEPDSFTDCEVINSIALLRPVSTEVTEHGDYQEDAPNSSSAFRLTESTGVAIVTELLQHVRLERERSNNLADRLTELEQEVETLRMEILNATPKRGLFSRVVTYLRSFTCVF